MLQGSDRGDGSSQDLEGAGSGSACNGGGGAAGPYTYDDIRKSAMARFSGSVNKLDNALSNLKAKKDQEISMSALDFGL